MNEDADDADDDDTTTTTPTDNNNKCYFVSNRVPVLKTSSQHSAASHQSHSI